MKAAIVDVDFTQDNTYSITVEFVDADENPLDYHLLTFVGRMKEQHDTTTAWNATVDQTAANVGVVVFAWTATQTAAMPDVVSYELRMTATGKDTFLAGKARIRRSLFV